MKQVLFIELQLMHSYYTDGRSPDFAIEPSQATGKLLQNHWCVFKPYATGARLFIAVSDTDTSIPVISLPNEMTLTFHLLLRNPEFLLFTDLTDIMAVAAPLFTNDVDETGVLSLTSRTASRTDDLAVQQPSTSEQFRLYHQPLAGIGSSQFIVSGLDGVSEVSAYDTASNTITVDSSQASINAPFSVSYPVEPQLPQGVWADVDIHLSDMPGSMSSEPAVFQISFQAKSAFWQYYVIVDKSVNDVNIVDSDNSIVFTPTNLTEALGPTDSTATMLAEQFPDEQRWRFISTEAVPCQKTSHDSIQLKVDGDVVLDHLPNPSLSSYSTVSVGGQTEDSLFQIITYS